MVEVQIPPPDADGKARKFGFVTFKEQLSADAVAVGRVYCLRPATLQFVEVKKSVDRVTNTPLNRA